MESRFKDFCGKELVIKIFDEEGVLALSDGRINSVIGEIFFSSAEKGYLKELLDMDEDSESGGGLVPYLSPATLPKEIKIVVENQYAYVSEVQLLARVIYCSLGPKSQIYLPVGLSVSVYIGNFPII